ncbi:hypothetical protein PR048_002489 [Dryococelus australis]|uniref:Dipeptidase n=1 Tax=Dryococelus australis TaxID=614101 RepID=A0ABQ9IMR6_9NEOP|nr:hypothetical protein PR048_002489 [Dryococelus australis]
MAAGILAPNIETGSGRKLEILRGKGKSKIAVGHPLVHARTPLALLINSQQMFHPGVTARLDGIVEMYRPAEKKKTATIWVELVDRWHNVFQQHGPITLPVIVPSDNNGPTNPLAEIPHHTISSGRLTACSTYHNFGIFIGPILTVIAADCSIQLRVTSLDQTIMSASNRGLMMVAFYPYFVSCSESATLLDVVAHINHIRDVAGVDHVGIGAGYDGINITPLGLEDVSRYPFLLAELLGSGKWTESDLHKLIGRNLIRVFQEVEQLALVVFCASTKLAASYRSLFSPLCVTSPNVLFLSDAGSKSVSSGKHARTVRLLPSQQGDPGSIPGRVTPGFSQIGIIPDDAAGRRLFYEISHYPRSCNPVLLRNHFTIIRYQDLDIKISTNLSFLSGAARPPMTTLISGEPVKWHCDSSLLVCTDRPSIPRRGTRETIRTGFRDDRACGSSICVCKHGSSLSAPSAIPASTTYCSSQVPVAAMMRGTSDMEIQILCHRLLRRIPLLLAVPRWFHPCLAAPWHISPCDRLVSPGKRDASRPPAAAAARNCVVRKLPMACGITSKLLAKNYKIIPEREHEPSQEQNIKVCATRRHTVV